MKNLAGKPTEEINRELRRELEQCGIEIIEGQPADHPEVKATVRGKLGPISFYRSWYYWVANGPVPLEVAQRLYTHPVGKTDVRVSGDCTCPAPEGNYVEWIADDGVKLLEASGCEQWERIFKEGSADALARSNARFSDDPQRDGKPFITYYHIDSELGLYLFAEAVKTLTAESGEVTRG